MLNVIKINPKNPQRRLIKKAAELIQKGGLVGFPTETVYGIAASIQSTKKLDKIKNRPPGKPYTIHIGYKKDIYKFIDKINSAGKKLIRKYWPGPLTIILTDKNGGKIGFRMPDNKIALSLIRTAGVPIVAPSANKSGMQSPVKAEDVCEGLDLVIDGGMTKYRGDSTIVDVTSGKPVIVRQGYIKIKK